MSCDEETTDEIGHPEEMVEAANSLAEAQDEIEVPTIWYVEAERHLHAGSRASKRRFTTSEEEAELWAERLQRGHEYVMPFLECMAEYENQVRYNEDGEPVEVVEDAPANEQAEILSDPFFKPRVTYSARTLDPDFVEDIADILIDHNDLT